MEELYGENIVPLCQASIELCSLPEKDGGHQHPLAAGSRMNTLAA